MLLTFASQPAMAFPINVEGRRVARTTRFIPHTDSPSYISLQSAYEAAPFDFLYYGLRLWLAPLTGSDALCAVRGALSGQVPPGCYRPNAPPAYTPKGQLAWLAPFIQLVISFVPSYTVKLTGSKWPRPF